MAKFELNADEAADLRWVLERYLPDLKREISHTDNEVILKFLKDRKSFMEAMLKRLNEEPVYYSVN